MSEHCANLAPYQFLTAFSQLISRVCHSSDEVFTVLMNIVAKVFLAYPQQAMWLMTAVSKVCVSVAPHVGFEDLCNVILQVVTFLHWCLFLFSVILPNTYEPL